MYKKKILCYIVTYNASAHIEDVLNAIPLACWKNELYDFHVLISDDGSQDNTYAVCDHYRQQSPYTIMLQRTRHNIGYGGNQKLGYDFAIANGYDAVVLLHGDGQYDPGCIPVLLEPLLEANAMVVLGSRMLCKKNALKGGMPFYKFFGNIALTRFQNRIAGSNLSEFHTGFRAYATDALRHIHYGYNSNGYIFDTEILLQCIAAGFSIIDIAIPTHYGDETCHVNGPKYAWRIVKATLAFKMHRLGFGYRRQYDNGANRYPAKTDFYSSHAFATQHAAKARVVLDIGGSSGYVAAQLREKGIEVYGFDLLAPDAALARNYTRYTQVDLDQPHDWTQHVITPDTVLLLDILEHLREPQKLTYHLRDILDEHTKVIITLPNIAFITIRLKLLFGSFSYSSRGILDHTHLHFFTFRSIKALLAEQGFAIVTMQGIPAPFPLVIKNKKLAHAMLTLNRWLIAINKGLFSFQIAIIAMPKPISHTS
jgi:glycosyltransferase involved in cell wall biosynthesis